MSEVKLEDIVSLCKRRGFIFPGSDVYGGLSGTWDYGPLGVSLKRNIMQLWWKMFVDDADNMYGIDAAILMNQKVWQASGHVDTFTDPLIECMNCQSRFRVDKLIDEADYKSSLKIWTDKNDKEIDDLVKSSTNNTTFHNSTGQFTQPILDLSPEFNEKMHPLAMHKDQLVAARNYVGTYPAYYLGIEKKQKCNVCGQIKWSPARKFNMMFETRIGPATDSMGAMISKLMIKELLESNIDINKVPEEGIPAAFNKVPANASPDTVYLRPETAQGIFTNFKNVVDTIYPDLPFGLAQQGKAFRNEISPRDFVFRSREFEQMEIEYFVNPANWEQEFEIWVKRIHEWCDALGLPNESVHELEVEGADRAHYSKRTIDFEFDFPIGREELLGLAYRTDFDLSNIQRVSGKTMEYRPKDGSAPFVPHVIEPSFGLERAIMATLSAAYTEDEVNGEKRIYLKLPNHLAPVKVAVSPLLKNKPELVSKAREVYAMLKKEFGNVMWDDNGNIGKRYRRQDEIGTPYCVVIDFETLEGDAAGTVTVRNRDSTEQTRISIYDLIGELSA